MGYFQVRYDSRVVNYDCRGFIRLATDLSNHLEQSFVHLTGYEFSSTVSHLEL